MVIHLLLSVFMFWLKTKQVAVTVIKLFLTGLSNSFAKKLAMLAFLIFAKKHLPKPSV